LKRLIANELLPIYQTTDTGEKVIDARELCGFLNIATRYNDWIKNRIEKYGFVDGEDFITLTENLVSGGQRNVHILKLDMAKELAMVENNEQGRKARRYFIEVEKRFKAREDSPKVPVVNVEHDRIAKLLQMLRTAERERLFTPKLDRAFREEIAQAVLSSEYCPYPTLYGSALPEPESFVSASAPYDNRWYLTKEIADLAGVSTQMVAAIASSNGMRSEEYSRVVKSDPRKQSGLVQIMYNEQAKDKLLQILRGRKSKRRKQHVQR
jgi:phage anti-repressor protein